MAKYNPLCEWLRSKANAGEEEAPATFSEIDEILGNSLPPSAKKHKEWWDNNQTHAQAIGGWKAAGWRVAHVDIDSEQVIFERGFNEPVFISEAIRQLNRKSVIICPDTCVLSNFVKLRGGKTKNSSWLDHFDEWEKQLTKCKTLLSDEAVGWVIPEQIKREFEDKLIKREFEDKLIKREFKDKLKEEFQPFDSVKKNLISEEELNGSIAELNSGLRDIFDDFKYRAKNYRKKIIRKAVLLKEEQHSFIHDAWSLVHGNEFPNNEKGKQQMKDSVILSHLCELYRFEEGISGSLNDSLEESETPNRPLKDHSGINSRIYFWTFDGFDEQMNDQSRRFFQKGTQNYIEIKNNILSIHLPMSNPLDSQILDETVSG